MPEKHNGIPLTTGKFEAQLNDRQLTSYTEHRRKFIEWMLTCGKDPKRGEGYAPSTVKSRAYRLDNFYRLVWDAEGHYTEHITTAHANAWVELLKDTDYSETYKASCVKALLSFFNWRADRTNSEQTWEPPYRFSSNSAHQPRDYLRKDERSRIREAALEFGSVPNYYSVSQKDRREWNAYLAQRFGKPIRDVTAADWQDANSWKIPSIIWSALDAGLRPIEVGRARVTWVDTTNQVLRIPKEDSAKNTENWETSLQSRTVMALERWLEERELHEKYDDTDALWLTRYGNPYSSQSLNPLLAKLCDEAGIEYANRNLTWYSIRHSVGTYMTREEDLKAAATQFRHKTTRTTVKYDQAPVEDRRDALKRMG
ncbi:tyrosine-type recombinase/integrase [Haloprofundus salinisoli]|uniref:tyrosine-type recombinase/integrase n=1 Tax=Haloprofundus salinisoli TaxID=2876193 RepID=UPI001CD0220B|nr:site-specific integrase [Haloprofundus salinisoli]